MNTFGQILRRLIRIHTPYTIHGWAIDIGFPKTIVYHWANDLYYPPMDRLIIMAEYFADVSGKPFTELLAMFCVVHPLAQQITQRRRTIAAHP